VQTQEQGGLEVGAQGKFGLSCEALQSRFHMRSKNLQDFSNSYSGADDMSLAASARAVMKASAVLRTLRRASDCAWVVAGNNDDDIKAVGKVAGSILANNPCAPVAIAELQLLDTPGEEGGAHLARAMSILISDTCEYEDQGQEPNESDEIADFDDIEIEERVQDGVEQMLEIEDTSSSLVQQTETQRKNSLAYVVKVLGAIMLGVLVSLGCAYAGFTLSVWVGFLFSLLLLRVGIWLGAPPSSGLPFVVTGMFVGGSVGGISSVTFCGSQFHQAVSSLMLEQ